MGGPAIPRAAIGRRRGRFLSLESHEVLGHLQGGHRRPLEQMLALQQCAVEGSGAEHVAPGHRTMTCLVSCQRPCGCSPDASSSWTTRVYSPVGAVTWKRYGAIVQHC